MAIRKVRHNPLLQLKCYLLLYAGGPETPHKRNEGESRIEVCACLWQQFIHVGEKIRVTGGSVRHLSLANRGTVPAATLQINP